MRNNVAVARGIGQDKARVARRRRSRRRSVRVRRIAARARRRCGAVRLALGVPGREAGEVQVKSLRADLDLELELVRGDPRAAERALIARARAAPGLRGRSVRQLALTD